MAVNNFLPFCPTDTGTNLLNQSDYAASADRTSGNKPGVASSKLNNKAIRQGTYVVSQFAQYLSDKTGTDLLDDATPAKLLAQINSALIPHSPTITSYLTGSGNHNLTYKFSIMAGNATAAATYTNNGVTYTVKNTVTSGLLISMSGNGASTVSGTLTKASGTGDATLTFYAVRMPLYLRITAAGAGSGGGNSVGGSSTAGGSTTFGTSLIVCSGGAAASGNTGGAGGAATLGTGPVGIAVPGGAGQSPSTAPGGGGMNPFGGSGSSAAGGNIPTVGATNTGAGGGGQGASGQFGGGGGAGGYVNCIITSPLSTYAWAVGAGGAGGGSSAAGAAGIIIVEEHYQ